MYLMALGFGKAYILRQTSLSQHDLIVINFTNYRK